jgi:membrane protease YdiL (CAAX protease family)
MKTKPLTAGIAFAWAFCAALLLIGTLGVLATLVPSSRTDIVTLGGVEALVFIVASLAVLRVHGGSASAADALALRPTDPTLLVLGLALGLALLGPSSALQTLVERVSPTPSELLALRSELFRVDSPLRTALLVAVAGCGVPLVEELFFRGALFGGLAREHSLRTAAWVVAVCFAVTRPDLRTWPSLLAVGAAASHLRVVSGSVVPCVALHVGFNGADIAAALSGVGPAGTLTRLPPAAVVSGTIMTALLVFAIQHFGARSDLARTARDQDAL